MIYKLNKNFLRNKLTGMGMYYSEFAKLIGVSEISIKKWFSNDNSQPKDNIIEKMSKILNVPLSDLIIVDSSALKIQVKKVPIIGSASCGVPDINQYQDSENSTYCSVDIWNEKLYAIIADGDSMSDLIENGDEVICDPSAEIKNGDIVHYQTNGESAIKIYIDKKNIEIIELVPYNRNGIYKTINFKYNDEILGEIKKAKVIEINKKVDNNRLSRVKMFS